MTRKYPVTVMLGRFRKVEFHHDTAILYRRYMPTGYWDYLGSRSKTEVRHYLKDQARIKLASIEIGCQGFLRSSNAIAFARRWVRTR